MVHQHAPTGEGLGVGEEKGDSANELDCIDEALVVVAWVQLS